MYAVSFLSVAELDALRPESFVLADLSFTGVNPGVSLLTLENVILNDAFGFTLSAPILQGAEVDLVPEPCTMLLVGSELIGAVGLRRKVKKKNTIELLVKAKADFLWSAFFLSPSVRGIAPCLTLMT